MTVSPRKRLRVGVLASGRGSNLQTLIDAGRGVNFPAEVVLVLSDNKEADALECASAAGIRNLYLNPQGK